MDMLIQPKLRDRGASASGYTRGRASRRERDTEHLSLPCFPIPNLAAAAAIQVRPALSPNPARPLPSRPLLSAFGSGLWPSPLRRSAPPRTPQSPCCRCLLAAGALHQSTSTAAPSAPPSDLQVRLQIIHA